MKQTISPKEYDWYVNGRELPKSLTNDSFYVKELKNALRGRKVTPITVSDNLVTLFYHVKEINYINRLVHKLYSPMSNGCDLICSEGTVSNGDYVVSTLNVSWMGKECFLKLIEIMRSA